MSTKNTNPANCKPALFWLFFFSASILLIIPALLNDIRHKMDSPPATAVIEPISQRFWNELNQTRQLVQNELNTFSNPRAVKSSVVLRKSAQLHFQKAMALLPPSVRALPNLREIQAGVENDLELLQLEKNIIRELAAKQIIIGIDRIERFVTHYDKDIKQSIFQKPIPNGTASIKK